MSSTCSAPLGVKFHTNCLVGKTVTIDELREQGFKGIYVATGAGKPKFMNIPGENAIHILSANEFLFRVNVMDADQPDSETPLYVGKKVIVVGGGNTAMDSCRTAKRLGADVTVVYRRTFDEMPAGRDEIEQAQEEGVNFMNLHNPQRYIVGDDGKVKRRRTRRDEARRARRLGSPPPCQDGRDHHRGV